MPEGPVVGVGAIVVRDNAVLLVLRGKAPNKNQWAIPGGRLRLGETLQQGAEREVLEETGITIRAGEVVFSFEHIERVEEGRVAYHYVVLDLAAEYLSGRPQAGDDAKEARWVSLDTLGEFQVNRTTLRALRQIYPDSVK